MKPRLPKLLITAVLAAVCAANTYAADYKVYNTGTYSYDIVQWTGGTTANQKNGLCYGPWYKTTCSDGVFTVPTEQDVLRDSWSEVVTSSDFCTILLDENSSANTNGEVYYDINGVKFSGIIVTADSKVDKLYANTGLRSMTLGQDGGYTSIARNFFLDLASNTTSGGSNLTFAGSQTWSVDTQKTFSVQVASHSSMTNTGTLILTGGGTVDFQSKLINATGKSITVGTAMKLSHSIQNDGSITMAEGGSIIIDSFNGFVKDFDSANFSDLETGEHAISTLISITTGNGISGLTQVQQGDNTLTVTEGKYVTAKVNTFVIAANDTVEVGETRENIYALAAETSKLVFTGEQSTTLTQEVTGNGRVEVTLVTPTQNHGRGVQLGSTFNGTLSVKSGWMDLTLFTMGANATLELNNGQHWSSGSKTISQDINLMGEKGSYIFRNSDTLTLSGTVTGTYLDMGTTVTNDGTLVLAGTNNDIKYVTVGSTTNTMNLEVAENMAFTKITAEKASSSVIVNSGKTLTIKGGTAEGDKISTIGTLNAANATVDLGSGVMLNLQGTSTHNIGTVTTATNGNTINLATGATLNTISTVNGGGSLTLDGNGTYVLTRRHTMTDNVALASSWSGAIAIKGANPNGSFNRYDIDNLNDLESLNSKVILNGVSGWLQASSTPGAVEILTTNIELQNFGNEAAWVIDDGYSITYGSLSNRVAVISGNISGTGDIEKTNTNGNYWYRFEGDLSQWSGALKVKEGTMRLDILSTTDAAVNATLKKDGGTFNLTIDNSGHTTTFSKEVTVNKLKLTSGSTMSITATQGEGDTVTSKLSAESYEFGVGSQLNVSGSLTLDATAITLTAGSTFTTADSQTLIALTGGTLTVNNVDTWTVGSYTIDGKEYTTSLSVADNSLKLNFTAVSNTQDVYISMDGTTYANNMLTLAIVDAYGNQITADNASCYNVAGLYQKADWETIRKLISGDQLVGITLLGNGFSVTGNGVDNISFYNAYVGEGNRLYNASYIPEPATATLSLLALAGLAARRRRNR